MCTSPQYVSLLSCNNKSTPRKKNCAQSRALKCKIHPHAYLDTIPHTHTCIYKDKLTLQLANSIHSEHNCINLLSWFVMTGWVCQKQSPDCEYSNRWECYDKDRNSRQDEETNKGQRERERDREREIRTHTL